VVSTCLFSYVQWNNDVAEQRVKHTLQVKERIQTIVKAAVDVQSSVRGYIARGDDRSLAAYHNACQAFPQLLTNLEVTVRDDQSQSAHAMRIRSLSDDMLAHVNRMLVFVREKNTSSTEFQKLGMETKALVDKWHQELDLIVADE